MPVLGRTFVCLSLLAATVLAADIAPAGELFLYASVGEPTRPPIGWVAFCEDYPTECSGRSSPKDVVLTTKAWKELGAVNRRVNDTIKPMTDLDHYGVVEKWVYPDDGFGDCEDYALLKRRMLIEGGWPREALLMTVVREQNGDGHAVLTIKTDRGEFVLDNQNDAVLLWSDTPYRFIKRQSQFDPNAWVSLGDLRPAAATASSR